MQEPVAQQDLNNLDLSKIAGLQQKRTLAFVNHFVITTVQFLNNFMKQCEQKLMLFERKLEKVEAAMVLLETRLQSIPEVSNIALQESSQPEPKLAEAIVNQANDQNDHKMESKACEETINENESKIAPEYERFIKMYQVGVPLDAVKLKVSLEGLDPNELDKYLR